MITLTYLGAIVCGSGIAFVAFWFGYLICAMMAAAANTDDKLGIRG